MYKERVIYFIVGKTVTGSKVHAIDKENYWSLTTLVNATFSIYGGET